MKKTHLERRMPPPQNVAVDDHGKSLRLKRIKHKKRAQLIQLNNTNSKDASDEDSHNDFNIKQVTYHE